MNFLALIEAKRDGQAHSPEQIRQAIAAIVADRVPDYQIAAWLMAVFFRGMTPAESTALTLAMRDSGAVLRFPRDSRPLVDKHSTGGVGDKVSLPLAPLLACLGFRVPMISGRGLGITGGTLDKLDSIPGFCTRLPERQIVKLVQEIGCVICGQTDRMVPADKKLYALRDVTGTVPSRPLIVASILSKKLAENLRALVLDVKFGRAAFMSGRAAARGLAQAMVALGAACGINTRALLTRMDHPLGRAAGNWLEVREAVACLSLPSRASRSTRPLPRDDLRELVLACAAHLLVQTGKASSLAAAHTKASECLDSGAPLAKWRDMLAAQGADLDAYERKLARDHTAPVVVEVRNPRHGLVADCNARVVGELVRELGGGRLTQDAAIDPDVGVDQLAQVGEPVERNGVLGRVHATNVSAAQQAARRLQAAFVVSDTPPRCKPVIAEVLTPNSL